MDLLTTYTHDPELQTLTTLSLMYTLYRSLLHPLSLFQPAVSSPAVTWKRFLTVEILQLHALRSSLRNLPCKTQLNSFKVWVRVTLRLAVYRQSIRLGDKPLETHDQ
jgi:hypothetical protein